MNSADESLPDSAAGGPEAERSDFVLTRAEITQWDGPLPPPEAFQSYENTLPGAAERLLKMAEEQHKHRISREQSALEIAGKSLETARKAGIRDSWQRYLGMILGFILVLAGLAGGIFLASIGRDGAGLTFGLASLAGLAGVFVYGARSRSAERRRNVTDAGDV